MWWADQMGPRVRCRERLPKVGSAGAEQGTQRVFDMHSYRIRDRRERGLIGSSGSLATQTRRDLAAGASMAERVQTSPAVADPIEANRIGSEATRYKLMAITIPRMQQELCILAVHDAARANADDPDDVAAGNAGGVPAKSRLHLLRRPRSDSGPRARP
eukprot:4635974-Pyramimonas_sp.AAC.1